jgi:hypothetical protein
MKKTIMGEKNFKKNSFLIYALLFALVCRILVAITANSDQSRYIDPDSNDYIELANHMVAGDGYTKGEEPEIFRAPGYPFFLVPFRKIFPNKHFPVILIQIILSVSTIFILWHLAIIVEKGNIQIAKFAVLFQTLTLTSVVFSNKILSETLFTFLMITSLLLLELSIKSENIAEEEMKTRRILYSRIFAILAGCVAAITLMVRAILLPILPLFVVYILVRIIFPYEKNTKQTDLTDDIEQLSSDEVKIKTRGFSNYKWETVISATTLALIFLMPILLAYGSWRYRNTTSANFAGFSSVGQINIYRYYACLLLAKNNGITFDKQQAICTEELVAQGTQSKQAEYAMKKGVPILLKEPIRYFFLHLKTDISSLLPDVGDLYRLIGFEIGGSGTLSVIRSQGILAGVKHYFNGRWRLFILALPLVALMFVKFTAATVGATLTFKSPARITLLFYVVIILYMLIVPGGVSHPRFRVPVEPLLSLLAAYGLVWGIDFIRKRGENPAKSPL